MTCNKCNGLGVSIKYPCEPCRGTGIGKQTVKETVTVPAGINNG